MSSRKLSALTCLFVVSAFTAGLAIPVSASANSKYASIVVDGYTGADIRARNADAPRYPASLTKIMTLYVLFSEIDAGRIKMTDRITFSAHAAAQPPSKLGLKPGETITVDNAIRALVTKSANDVAAAVGEHIAGTEWKFAQRMTEVARRIGMNKTTFRNASGLPHGEQKTTARDMATLGMRIMQDFPEHYKLFRTKSFTFKGKTYSNHNRLLGKYAGTEGIKTGYIRDSGYNLVASVRRGDKFAIGVVMGGKTGSSRDAHMRQILDESFPKLAAHKGPPPRAKPELIASLALIRAATPEPVAARPAAVAPATAKPAPVPARLDSTGVVRLTMVATPPRSRELPLTEPISREPVMSLSNTGNLIRPTLARATALRQLPPTAMSAYQASSAPTHPVPTRPTPVATAPAQVALAAAPARVAPAPAPQHEAEDAIERLIAAAMANPALAISGVPAVQPGRLIRPEYASSAVTPISVASFAEPEAPLSVDTAFTPEPETIEVPEGYQIQVGAYATQGDAQERLERAQESAKELLAEAMGFTPSVEKDSGTIYRARFAGLDKNLAQRACKTLKQRKIDCIVVAQ